MRPRQSESRKTVPFFLFLFSLFFFLTPLPHFNEADELPGDRTPVQPQMLQTLMPPWYKPLGMKTDALKAPAQKTLSAT
jgi:hypothetical protein